MTVSKNLERGAFTVDDPARVTAALERACPLFPIFRKGRRQVPSRFEGPGRDRLGDAELEALSLGG